jgi:hypothetical protein
VIFSVVDWGALLIFSAESLTGSLARFSDMMIQFKSGKIISNGGFPCGVQEDLKGTNKKRKPVC